MDFFFNFNLVTFIKAAGYLGIFGVVFAESGLLFGFFLPGDSLLFTAGFLASEGYFNVLFLLTLCFLGAILGDSFGYAFGKKTGEKLFAAEDSLIFKKAHLERARIFYEAHGGKTIMLARFMPIVRTFVPIVAGVGMMKYRDFLFYNIIGIPIAARVFATWGLVLKPELAGLAMALSSVSVVSNSLLLRRFRPLKVNYISKFAPLIMGLIFTALFVLFARLSGGMNK